MEKTFYEKLQDAEQQRFDKQQEHKRLEGIYNQHNGDLQAISDSYNLTSDQKTMLNDIDAQKQHEVELSRAFLQGFKNPY